MDGATTRSPSSGQYLARVIEIATAGTTIFLLETADTGIPPAPSTIGEARVEDLADTLVRVITEAAGTAD